MTRTAHLRELRDILLRISGSVETGKTGNCSYTIQHISQEECKRLAAKGLSIVYRELAR